MKMYVFERVDKVSEMYHPEGGLMVVAKDRDHAKSLIEAEPEVEVTEVEWKDVTEYYLDDFYRYEPRVIAFPDAGCC